MTAFMLHIIKRNVIAAVVILLVGIVAAVTKGKYTSRWKYDMWLIISLFLLFPVNISGISPIRLQVVQQQMEDGKLDRLRKRLEEIHKEDENDNDTAGVA